MVRDAGQERAEGRGPELWWGPLDLGPATLRADTEVLSADELARADRFPGAAERSRFVAGRAAVRRVLGAELGCPPKEVALEVDGRGKPRVVASALRFSSSRSADRVLCATSWTMEVGVDLEAVRDGPDIEAIAARFFTPAENDALGRCAPADRVQAAFQCWSCKEAYVKGTGEGLSGAVASFDVWTPEGSATTIGGWRVVTVDVGPGFAAAVAAESVLDWTPGGPHPI